MSRADSDEAKPAKKSFFPKATIIDKLPVRRKSVDTGGRNWSVKDFKVCMYGILPSFWINICFPT